MEKMRISELTAGGEGITKANAKTKARANEPEKRDVGRVFLLLVGLLLLHQFGVVEEGVETLENRGLAHVLPAHQHQLHP
jgi:hypothetical protein